MTQMTFAERTQSALGARKEKDRPLLMGRMHPTTSDIEYTREELNFFDAIQHWKNRTGRQFPTWREVLAILRSLGYEN